MYKIKEFRDGNLDELLMELDKFINDSNIEVYSFSHSYTKSRHGLLNTLQHTEAEIILIYKEGN